MIAAITVLLAYQLLGEVLVQSTGLPVPGPVAGMAALFLTLSVRGAVGANLRDTAQGMLSHLSLLFVPAGVGVMLHAQRIAEEWLAIGLALLGSTVLTVAVTALVVQAVERLRAR